MELNLAQPTYQHVSQDVGNVRLVNWFLTTAKQSFETDPKYSLLPTAGKRVVIDLGGNEVRAVMEINGTVYAVVDTSVYKLAITEGAVTATSTFIGTISTSQAGKIYWAANSTQVMLVDGTATGGYIITQATDAFAKITDTDFTGASTVVFMDSYFLYNTPNAQTMFATASNDGLTVSALDVASAEGAPDQLVGLGVDKRELWAFGKKTVEIWYDAANPEAFPFSRRDGAYIDIGCGAAGSILNFDNSIIWLDNRGFVVRANNYSPEIISDPAISSAISQYRRTDDALAFTHVDRGSLFYILTFPDAKKTWAYDASTQQWHERAYFTQGNNYEHDLVNCQTRWGNYDIVGLRNSGKICVWDASTYTDGGDPIHRLIRTSFYQQDLAHIGINNLEVQFETGKAAATDPQPFVSLRYSHNNGYTWSDELWRSLGREGEYAEPITWNRLGSSRKWQLELTVHAPQKLALVRATVDVSAGK